MGHVPQDYLISGLRPVGMPLPTGHCVLEVHHMNRHSRKDAGQETDQHIPEEVLHGHNPLSEDAPTARTL